MAKSKTAGPARPARTAEVQVNARLTVDEKRALDALVAARDEAAERKGYAGGGFNGWLREVIREKSPLGGAEAAPAERFVEREETAPEPPRVAPKPKRHS